VIVQNKDDVLVPLLLEQIPSAKAFRDAIESLSPEQQRFAKAFRAMQLESTLFGVAVVEIKPQLERLLKLNADALTKEIRLTQDSWSSSSSTRCRPICSPTTAKFKNVMQQPKKLMKKTRKPRIDGDFMSSSAMRDEAPGAGAGAASMSMDMDDNDAAGDMREMAAAPEPSGGEGGNGDGGAASDEKPSGEQQQRERGDGDADGGVEFDVTQLPTRIDGKLEELDEEGAVAPTTIKLADDWTKKSFASLLANEQVELLQKDELRTEKNKAFDMLDALSRSGDLELRFCELHVVILATHMFAQSLMHTVARGNVNPIEKAEKSNLILASELFGEKPAQLVNKSELERVRMYSSNIFN
jgi:hypothetical protein